MDILDFYREVAWIQAEHGGLPGLARVLMNKISRTVIITDAQGFVQAWQCSPQAMVIMDEYIGLPGNTKDPEILPVSGVITAGGQKYEMLCWPIGREKTRGYLLLLASQSDLILDLVQAVELILLTILVELTHRQELKRQEQLYRDDFVRKLLFNNFNGLDEMLRTGQLWDFDFTKCYTVMVIEHIQDGKNGPCNVITMRDQLERYLGETTPGCLVGALGDLLVTLLPSGDRQSSLWKSDIQKIYDAIIRVFAGNCFYAGIGKPYGNSMFYRSYQEAKVALELGKMLRSTVQLIFFDELGAVRLFYNQSEQDLEEFFQEVLGPLDKNDHEKNGDLLLTLWYYLTFNRSSSVVAEKLYIHPNTLRYRIRKIEELLGISLEDVEKRFNIYAALKVAAILNKISGDITK